MRTDVGLLDRLFGKKTTLEVPQADGSVRRVLVTVRWLEEMERSGKFRAAGGQSIKAHILDPQAGLGQVLGLSDSEFEEFGVTRSPELYRVEEWTVGEQISAEDFAAFGDRRTREVFIIISYEAGVPQINLAQEDAWQEARAVLENI